MAKNPLNQAVGLGGRQALHCCVPIKFFMSHVFSSPFSDVVATKLTFALGAWINRAEATHKYNSRNERGKNMNANITYAMLNQRNR